MGIIVNGPKRLVLNRAKKTGSLEWVVPFTPVFVFDKQVHVKALAHRR